MTIILPKPFIEFLLFRSVSISPSCTLWIKGRDMDAFAKADKFLFVFSIPLVYTYRTPPGRKCLKKTVLFYKYLLRGMLSL